MADDNLLLNAIQTGANIGNMRVMRQERMMELQSQEALRQIQERHLAAQAQMLDYNLQQAQAEKAQDDKALQDYQLLRTTLHETAPDLPGMTPEESAQKKEDIALQTLITKRPAVGLRVAQAQLMASKPEQFQQQLKSREEIAAENNATRIQNTQTRLEGTKYTADKRFQAAQDRLNSPTATGSSAAGKYGNELRASRLRLQAAYDTGDMDSIMEEEQFLKDVQGYMEKTHPDKSAVTRSTMLMSKWRETYKAYLAGDRKLKPEVDRLEGELAKAGTALDTTGTKNSPSAQGEEMVPIIGPNGKRGKIPKSKYDAAIQSGKGFKPVP